MTPMIKKREKYNKIEDERTSSDFKISHAEGMGQEPTYIYHGYKLLLITRNNI